MSEERMVSITSSLHLAPDDVARHTFATVRRGFDPDEVRAYLESVAAGLRTVADHEHELLKDLADAKHRAANPVLDEPTLTAAVGAETARVLHSAHEVAAEAVAKAEAEADRLLTAAREEIEQNRTTTAAELEERRSAVESAAAELRDRTDRQVAARLDQARQEAEELLAQAREQCRAMVDEAQGLRARVLSDLARRRKALHAQIEQLRAGRERLAETIHDVRTSIDVIADELFAAEDNARLAAESAGREAVARPDEGSPEELAAELLAEEAEVAGVAEVAKQDEEAEVTEVAEVTEAVEVVGIGGDGSDTVGTEAVVREGSADRPRRGGPTEPPEESVDALFAKLRAASSAKEKSPSTATAKAAPGRLETASGVVGATVSTPTAAESPPTGPVAEGAADGAERSDDHDHPGEPDDGPPEGRHPLAVHRDELIGPIVTALSRRLKRTLQDNQNELLDALRSKGFHWSTDLLPGETEHVDSYATAALPSLEQAAVAGASFARTGTSAVPHADVLVGIGHDLAESVVGPLRRRLAGGEGLEGAEESVVADHVGSAFREWKGERIERLAGDHVVAAFSEGSLAAAGAAPLAQLEWVAVSASDDPPCPDCEDNGLNGTLRPGEAFPTGHQHPPAHPGCRCLLVIPAT